MAESDAVDHKNGLYSAVILVCLAVELVFVDILKESVRS